MNNKEKINTIIEEIVNNQGFFDMLDVGIFIAMGFTKINKDFKKPNQTNNNLIEILKNSIIDTSNETYQELKKIIVVLDIFHGFNDFRNTLEETSFDIDSYIDSYDEFMYIQTISDLHSQFIKVFKFN